MNGSRASSRICWQGPARNDAVVLTGSDQIVDAILEDVPYTVIPTRHERLYLSLGVMARMVLNSRFVPGLLRSRRAASLASAVHFIYLLSAIERTGARVAITTSDNYPHVWWLARRLEGRCRLLPIQNAVRHVEVRHLWPQEPGERGVMDVPEYVCFGKFEEDLFREYGHRVDRFHPVGSPKGGYYRSVMAPERTPIGFDLCLVSSWQPDDTWYEWESPTPKAATLMERHLARFVAGHQVRSVVAMRSTQEGPWKDWTRLEREHYESLFGPEVTLVARDDSVLSTYECMDRSRVIVTHASSAAFEGFGWGKRTLFCTFASATPEWARFPVPGPWVLEDETYEAFELALDGLLTMTDARWDVVSSTARGYLMQYEPDGPAHRYVRDLVLDTLQRSGVGRDARS